MVSLSLVVGLKVCCMAFLVMLFKVLKTIVVAFLFPAQLVGKSEHKEEVVTRVFPDRQTDKEKVPEVNEKERKTYAEVPLFSCYIVLRNMCIEI